LVQISVASFFFYQMKFQQDYHKPENLIGREDNKNIRKQKMEAKRNTKTKLFENT